MALKNVQYEEIIRIYDKQQIQNQHDLNRRIAQVYQIIPAMKQLDDEVVRLSASSARRLLMNDTAALKELKEQLATLKRQRKRLLLSHGFDADYMEMHYRCEKCKDTGYVQSQKCDCFKQHVIDMLYTQSNLKDVLERENFDTFTFEWYDSGAKLGSKSVLQQMEDVYRKCRNMVEHFGENPQNLLLTGPTGTGKTFLTHCIAKYLMDACFSVIYLSAIDLFDIFSRQQFGEEQEQKEEEYLFQSILDCDLLIIDDLGTEMGNSFTNTRLFYCMNERAAKHKAMVISTNLSLNQLRNEYSERIISRIVSDYEMLELAGADIRIKKKLYRRC
jgi:DNA replication protein DnaC